MKFYTINQFVSVLKIKTQLFVSFLIFSGLILFNGCMYVDDRLTITNLSKFEISVAYSNEWSDIYNNVDYYLADYNRIRPDSTGTLSHVSNKMNGWDSYIESGAEKKLYLYIFAVDTLIVYHHIESIEQLIYHRKYLKKFKYSQKDLVDNNWKVLFKIP